MHRALGVGLSVLLSGLLGALLVFVLGVIRELWRESRELFGLLRLLLTETRHNEEVIHTIAERLPTYDPDEPSSFQHENLMGHDDFGLLRTAVWDRLQARAASLLPRGLFVETESYYSVLQIVRTLSGFSDMVGDSFGRELRSEIQESRPDLNVPGIRNPYRSNLDNLVDLQYRVIEKLEEALARPWWGRVFLALDDRVSSLRRVREAAENKGR